MEQNAMLFKRPFPYQASIHLIIQVFALCPDVEMEKKKNHTYSVR